MKRWKEDKKHLFRFFILLVLLFTTIHASSGTLRAAIVLDASGSMWEQIGKSNKIEIAKNALRDVVAHWESKIPLGLTIYGHRRKGDCSDIELALPAAKLDKEKMLSIVKDIKPKGKTPISRALKITAKELNYIQNPVTLILISDGKETCDTAPLQTIKELKEKGVKLTVHVIGFNVGKDASLQLKNIASITGGSYFLAKDAASLHKAFKTIATKVQKSKPIVLPKDNLIISASETKGGKWIKAFHELYRLGADKNRTKIANCISYTHAPCKLKVPTGKYLIESSYNLYNKESQIETKENNISRVNVVMGQTGRLSLTAREKKGGPLIAIADLSILDENNKTVKITQTLKRKPYIERLPIGKYTIHYEYHGYSGILPFTIAANKTSKIDIITGKTGRVSVTASEVKGGKEITAQHTFYRKNKSGNIEKNITASCYSEETKPCVVQIPVGDYTINSSYKDMQVQTDVIVLYNKDTQKHIIMKPTGKVKIVARESSKDKPIKVSYMIISDENNSFERNQTVAAGKTDIRKAVTEEFLVGNYWIDARYCNYKKHLAFKVEPNSTNTVALIMGKTGYAVLSTVLEKNGKAVNADYTLYKDKNGTENIIVAECQKRKETNTTLQLPVGDYAVETRFAPYVRTKKFHVSAGKITDVHFVMKPSGSVKITVSEEETQKGVIADHTIYPVINGEANESKIVYSCTSEKKHPCIATLPIGDYLLLTRYSLIKRKTPFKIKEDELLPLHIIFGQTGDVNITAYDAPNGTALRAYHYIYKADGNATKSIASCALEKHCIKRLPVGKYIVRSEYGMFEKKEHFSVQSGKMTQVDIILDKSYPIRIETTLLPSGKKVRAAYEFFRKREDNAVDKLIEKSYLMDVNKTHQQIVKECSYNAKEQSCRIYLPVGRYILKSDYKDITQETKFKVKRGDKNIIKVTIETNTTKE